MPWWPRTFSSFSYSSSSSSSKSNQRRLTRQRKLRHICDRQLGIDLRPSEGSSEPSLSPSPSLDVSSERSLSAVSQPLPLPDLCLLLRRDGFLNPEKSSNSNPNSCDYRLPSPKELPNREIEERNRVEPLIGEGFPLSSPDTRFACHDGRRGTGQVQSRVSKKVPQNRYGSESVPQKFRLNIPTRSAPTSPFSSPTLSPQRMRTADGFLCQDHMATQATQVWSAPEIPPLEASPFHSPTVKSPQWNPISSSVPASLFNQNISLESRVHPLPLPPGAATSAATFPHVTAKTEALQMTSQWQKGKLIGRGTFGSVYVAVNRETGASCAMKEVELLPDDPKAAECIKQLEQEIKVLSQLKHKNIVQYYGSEIVGDRFYIYLEYVHPGSINKYVREHCGAITESVVRNFTRHILSGLAYLHSTKTIHRDIKGANLLVDASGVVKLADFGMAKHLTGQAAELSLKGSPYWMAPELMQVVMRKDGNADLALAVDIWSLGCTIIEMLNGKPPWSDFEGPAAMFKVLKESPQIPEALSSEGKDFLRRCFRRNPAERPSASMLLEHPFAKNTHHVEVPVCTQAFNGLRLADIKPQSPGEHSSERFDQLPTTLRTQTTKGKQSYTSETNNKRSHFETSELIVGPRHSPRSTLDTLPSLSPPHSGRSTNNSSPSSNVPVFGTRAIRNKRVV